MQNRSLGHIYYYANLIKPTHMWICAQQYVYEIYKEISNLKAFIIAESKKQCYFPGGMNNSEDNYIFIMLIV